MSIYSKTGRLLRGFITDHAFHFPSSVASAECDPGPLFVGALVDAGGGIGGPWLNPLLGVRCWLGVK